MKKFFLFALPVVLLFDDSRAFACFPSPEAVVLLIANERTIQTNAALTMVLCLATALARLCRGYLVNLWSVALFGILISLGSAPWRLDNWRGIDCGIAQADFSSTQAMAAGLLLTWQIGAICWGISRRNLPPKLCGSSRGSDL